MIADSCCHVECDCDFDSFHSSGSRRSEAGRLGECGSAPTTGRVQTQRSATKTNQPRSIILDRPLHDLAELEIRVDDRAAGNRNVLASSAVQAILVEVIPIETTWPSTNPCGDKETYPYHDKGQSNLGSAAGTRGIEKTRIQDFRADRITPH